MSRRPVHYVIPIRENLEERTPFAEAIRHIDTLRAEKLHEMNIRAQFGDQAIDRIIEHEAAARFDADRYRDESPWLSGLRRKDAEWLRSWRTGRK